GWDRCMAETDPKSDFPQPLLRGGPAMRRAVVDDPEQPFAGPIRFLSQHLIDEPAKGSDTCRRFTPAHDTPSTHIPGGQILQSPATRVFVLDIGGWARRRGAGGVGARAGPEAAVLV